MSRIILNQIALQKIKVISETKKYFLLQPSSAAAPSTSNYGITPPTYTQTGYSGWSDTEPSYTVGDDRVLYELTETIYSDRTWDYSTPTISSSYEAAKEAYNEAIQAEEDIQDFVDLGLKQGYIWDNPTSKSAFGTVPAYPAGSYIASGILSGGTRSINRSNSNTYGLNTWISTGGINLRYNAIDLMKLTTSNLFFYYPSTSTQQKKAISLGTNGTVNSLAFYGFNNDNKTMELTNNALTFYNPSNGTDKLATLNTSGLILSKGGVKAGTPNQSGFIYLSTEPYGSYSVNGSSGISDWKEIIGTKFGVDSEGNLYANEAHISGEITASKLTISSNTNISDTSGLIRNDAVEVGGRNLALNSKQGWSSTSYNVIQGTLSEEWEVGETYTVTIKGTPASAFGFWRDTGSACLKYTIEKVSGYDDLYRFTALCTESSQSEKNKFSVYDTPPTASHATSTIEWIKIERGNKATDWTPAPEDLEAYTDTQVNAAKAEIKVTTDEITSEVSKISSAKYVVSGNGSGWSLANIKTWAAEGYTTNWNVATGSTDNLRVGDVVYIKGTDTTRQCPVYVKVTVDAINSPTQIRATAHGYEDILPVETIKSTINQSADSVKIAANHVDIEGAAIFNSGRLSSDSLNDKYDELVDKANTKGVSRGEQLVTNGNGLMGDNTNFSTYWTFDGSQSCDSPGSFTRTGGYANIVTDEYFPIDTSKRYRFELDMKSANNTGTMYSMLCFYDVDKAPITAEMHMYAHTRGNTLTTLAQDLKAGDTSIKLTDASGYSTFGASNHMRSFIFWDYENSFGYTYPPKTYSRNWLGDAWVDDSSIDKTNNTITLKRAYTGPTRPAGTYVSQGYAGGNYKYGPLANNKIPTEWTHYVGYFDGVDYSGDNKYEMFPPGTAYAKVGFLWNYNSATDQFWVTNIQVYEDYKTDIDTALAKKSIHTLSTTYSFTYAQLLTYSNEYTTGWSVSSTEGVSVDDTVRLMMTVSDMSNAPVYIIGTVTEIVSATALRMKSHGIDTTVIDGGNILTNSITANQIKGNTITLGQIDTNVQNSILNENIEVGGRNLVTGSYNLNGFSQESSTKISVVYTDEDVTITNISSGTWGIFKDIPAEPSTNYTISFTCSDITGPARYSIGGWKADGTVIGSQPWNGLINYTAIANGKTIFSFETPDDCAKLRIYLSVVNANSTAKFKKIKLEKGNKATDWTPAPEDVASDIEDASKVAKNYLKFTDTGGLDIGYTGDANAHGKTNIQADGMRIYDKDDAVNPVAKFTVNGGQIGKDGESRLVLNSDGQTLINDNIVWFGVNKSGNPTVDDVPTQESFASNTAQNPSVTLKNTPNGRISVITQGQYMRLGSTYYTSRIEDTFTYGTTDSKSHSERIEVTTAASVTWTVHYDGNKTITISDSSHGGTATHRVIIQTVTYTVGAGTAVDLGVMTFGSTRGKPTGNGSVLLGRGLASECNNQVVLGRYNKQDKNNDNALIIGNGSSSSYTNAFSVGWDGDLTAAGGLTLHNHSSTVGTIKDAFRNVNQNINSGTWFTVCSLSLEAGVWLVKCNVTFKDITSPGGTYAIGITTSSSGEPWGTYIFGPPTTTSADKNVQYTQIVAPSSTQTYYLRARQSSGEQGTIAAGAAAGNNSIRAVRII